MNESIEESAIKVAGTMLLACGSIVFLGVVLVFGIAKYRPQLLETKMSRSWIPGALAMVGILIFASHALAPTAIRFPFALGAFWCFSGSIALLSFPVWKRLISSRAITVASLPVKTLRVVRESAPRGNLAFIGSSIRSGSPIHLTEEERVMHVLVSGSTGSGKTTVLKALFQDAVEKGQPVLIIDPKGNNKTIAELRATAESAGVAGERFKVFSLIQPHSSVRYNPLDRGSSIQIRDRLMGALEWSEPYYKHQASAWIGTAIDLLRSANLPVTIKRLHRLLADGKAAEEIEDLVRSMDDKARGKAILGLLQTVVRTNREGLSGLTAQLRDLDNLDFGFILDPETAVEQNATIDLVKAIENREVVYFQLNTMAYEFAAKVIGRLVLQDLKALASQIHGGQTPIEPTFFPIFIDEFGSFAFQGFIDFLKMSRDVGMANHLFFQSLADLDAITPEFKSQVQQNCLTKLILRTDDPAEVDFWAGVAGTRDSVESSYQVESFLGWRVRTGAGNMRFTKQMRVEHDVFKRLRIGQAVMIQKAPAREDLIQLWNPVIGSIR